MKDVARLVDVIRALAPQNEAQLVSAFVGVTRGPLHMQTVRNAAAHLNGQTFAEVLALRPYYISNPIRHPVEAAYWSDVASGGYALISWLEELRVIAEDATQ